MIGPRAQQRQAARPTCGCRSTDARVEIAPFDRPPWLPEDASVTTPLALSALLALLLSACGGDAAEGGGGEVAPPSCEPCEPLVEAEEIGDPVGVRFESGGEFFGRPFPDDTRRHPDGSIDLSGYPNPGGAELVDKYVSVIGGNTDGWGPNTAVYLPMSGPLHPDSLPPDDPEATRSPESSVYLVDADPGSPEAGARVPVRLRWQAEPTLFLPGNVLVLYPEPGVPLRDDHLYAAVVSTDVCDAACRPLLPADGEQAERLQALGLPAERIVGAAVFTTMPVLEPMRRIREAVLARPAPLPRDLAHVESTADYHLYEGRVTVPVFQDGDPPYVSSGGQIHFGADGTPEVQREENLRIAISMPLGGMPDRAGWPLVIYSHGTGGDYRSFVRGGVAAELARRGLACLGFDQVVHGERDPTNTNEGLTFVNLFNIVAARDNMRQGGADGFALMRMARAGISLRTEDTPDGTPAYTDPDTILFLGHSEGSLTGPPFVAVEPDVRAAAFSGAGALLKITLLQRTDPIDFQALARSALRLEDDDEPLDLFHPFPNLLQLFIEPADPVNFAPWFALLLDPQTRPRPANILILQGLLDEAVPADSSAAFIAASGADLAEPVTRPIPALALRGREPVPLPIRANLNGATVGALQFPEDGHFALFDNAVAARRTYGFLESAARREAEVPR